MEEFIVFCGREACSFFEGVSFLGGWRWLDRIEMDRGRQVDRCGSTSARDGDVASAKWLRLLESREVVFSRPTGMLRNGVSRTKRIKTKTVRVQEVM